MAKLRHDPQLAANPQLLEPGGHVFLILLAVEVLFTGYERHRHAVLEAVAQIGRAGDRVGAAQRDHAADVLRQREADGARHARSAGKAAQVGLLRVDAVGTADVVEHIEHDPRPRPGGDAVAGRDGRGEEDAFLIANSFPRLPAGGLIAGRDEQDQRRSPAGLVLFGHEELVALFGRIEAGRQLVRAGPKALHGECPVEPRRGNDLALGGRGLGGGNLGPYYVRSGDGDSTYVKHGAISRTAFKLQSNGVTGAATTETATHACSAWNRNCRFGDDGSPWAGRVRRRRRRRAQA